MDGESFDLLTRRLASGATRRALLRWAFGVTAGGLLGTRMGETNAAVSCPNAPCTGPLARPCSGPCVCVTWANGNSRCLAPSATTCGAAGQKYCNGGCIPKNQCCTAADCVDDGNPCTGVTCSGGACSYPALTDGTICGASQVCCSGGCCPVGQTCVQGVCEACGGQGQPCCPGEACTGDLSCDVADALQTPGPPTCEPCGGNGEICCGGFVGTCDTGNACFPNGRCQTCGAVGQACCVTQANTDGFCNAGAICQGAEGCVACGGQGQPCCPDNTCSGDLVCDVYNFDLQPGITCEPCGGNGEICCPGSSCDAGNFCFPNGKCQTCGAVGQSCCVSFDNPNGFCDPGAVCAGAGGCVACGSDGQPCCPGNTCNGDLYCDVDNADLQPGITCQPCGGADQVCCGGVGGSCDPGFACYPSGRCIDCGAAGEGCCYNVDPANGTCDAGATCVNGMCQ